MTRNKNTSPNLATWPKTMANTYVWVLHGAWRLMYLQHLYQIFTDAHLPRKCTQPLSSLQKHESIYFNDSCFHRHRRKYWTNSFQMNQTIWLQIEPTQTVSAGGLLCRRKEVTDSSFPVSWWNKKSWQRKTESCDITKTFSFQTPHGAWDTKHSAQLPSNGFKAPTFGSISRKGVDFN